MEPPSGSGAEATGAYGNSFAGDSAGLGGAPPLQGGSGGEPISSSDGGRPQPSGGRGGNGGTGGKPSGGGGSAAGGAGATNGGTAGGGSGSQAGAGGTGGTGGSGSQGNTGGLGNTGGQGNTGGLGNTGGQAGAGSGEPGLIEVIDDVTHAGVDCVLVRTDVADYYFDKQGAGMVSIIDRSGRDWVSWSKTSGHRGDYRGIPNMGPCCHPGYEGALTEIVVLEPERVALRSVPKQGSWETLWEFFPSHAQMTVIRAPSSYYLLYEGTPGGTLGTEDHIGFADGRLLPLAEGDFLEDLPAPEWVYFLDAELGRALLLLHPDDDDIVDTYWTFGTMTVFGFGRTCKQACTGMTRSGDRLILALTDEVTFPKLEQLAERLLEP